MPKRKFASNSTPLQDIIKQFLKNLGYTSFDKKNAGKALLTQVPKADVKIKFENKENIKLSFDKVVSSDGHDFQYCLFTTQQTMQENSMKFILYISGKKIFRVFVPTKGNTFCKKKKKAYGFCGCHDVIGSQPHNGDFKQEITKRMELGNFYSGEIPDIIGSPPRDGPPTSYWDGDGSREKIKKVKKHLDSFGRRDVLKDPIFREDMEKVCESYSGRNNGNSGIQTKSTTTTTDGGTKKLRKEIDIIPPEVMEIIFSYSDIFTTLFLLKRVCRLWKNIIDQPRIQKDMFITNWEKTYNLDHNEIKFRDELSMWCRLPLVYKFHMNGNFESPWYKLKDDEMSKLPNYKLLNFYYCKLFYCLYKIMKKEPKSIEFIPYQWGSNTDCSFQPIILRKNLNHELVEDLKCEKLKEMEDTKEVWGEYHYCGEGDCHLMTSEAFKNLDDIYTSPDWGSKNPKSVNRSELIKVLRKCMRFPDEFDFFDGFKSPKMDENQNQHGYKPKSDSEKFRMKFRKEHGSGISDLLEKYLLNIENHRYKEVLKTNCKKLVLDLRKDVFLGTKQEAMVKFSNFASEEVALLFWMTEVEDDYLVGYYAIVERDS